MYLMGAFEPYLRPCLETGVAVGDEHDVLQPAAGLDDALQRGARAAGHRAAQHEHRLENIYINQENILSHYLFVM